ncbi:uncharacterized protein LOC115928840 [Strongylocentrotus purpuratus]|uniref:Uncharacterized protein n=1 Tax=Strongylocentrotus purpuratus TaxID=7668 RepID=A0A7M7T485_STRPU|nr:uncharacterized protein LOC115928840 [Strongylocentrotus purpuratus]
MDDLERCGLHVQDTSSSSETDSEPRQREPSQHDRTKLVEQRNEVFARYEVLEEHNKRLEEQLRNFRAMIRKETSQGRTDHSLGSANYESLKHSPSFPPGNTTFHHGGSMNQVSNRSSGYQASSGYDRTGERLPPYGQSHPALDTIADHSSGSSGASAVRPRFVMMGKDYPDGRGDPRRGHPPLYTDQVSSFGVDGMGQPVLVNDYGQGNRSGGLGQHRSMAGPLSNVQTGSIQNLPPAPSYHHNMDPSALASPVYAHGPQTSASVAYQDSGDGAHNLYGQQTNASPVHHVGGVGAHRLLHPSMSTGTINQHHENSQLLLLGNQTGQLHSADIPFNSQHPSHLEQSHHVGFQIDQSHPSGLHTDQSHASRFQTDQSHASRFQTDQSHAASRFQMDKSRALESVLDLDRFLPHINDQSTVHFPTTGVSMAYPSEEAELDELIQRMTDAFPLHESPSPPPLPDEPDVPVVTMEELLQARPRRSRGSRRGSGDIFSAANRIGEAMSTLVTRVSVGGAPVHSS